MSYHHMVTCPLCRHEFDENKAERRTEKRCDGCNEIIKDDTNLIVHITIQERNTSHQTQLLSCVRCSENGFSLLLTRSFSRITEEVAKKKEKDGSHR